MNINYIILYLVVLPDLLFEINLSINLSIHSNRIEKNIALEMAEINNMLVWEWYEGK